MSRSCVFALIAASLIVLAVTGIAQAAPTCFGKPASRASFLGGSGDDIINGTSGNDVIIGGGGADTIDGKGGADLICGGPDV
ncbi:MAG TPA: hypothetical protein VHV50_12900, partial [Actinomycetota bacterium]|nr:hypothetical protein [Actinomycetota bacterium]